MRLLRPPTPPLLDGRNVRTDFFCDLREGLPLVVQLLGALLSVPVRLGPARVAAVQLAGAVDPGRDLEPALTDLALAVGLAAADGLVELEPERAEQDGGKYRRSRVSM